MNERGGRKYRKPSKELELQAYEKTLDRVFLALNDGADSADRIRILYGKRSPSKSAQNTFEKLKTRYLERKKAPAQVIDQK